jgi:hypothetical protein
MWEGFKPARYIFKNNAAPFFRNKTLSYVYDDAAYHRVVASSFGVLYLSLPPHRVFLGFGSHPLALGLCCSVSFAGASCNFACGDVPGPGVGRSISSLALARQEKRIRNNRQPRLLPTWSVRGASNTNHSSPPSVDCCLISTSPPSSPHQSRATTTTTFPR